MRIKTELNIPKKNGSLLQIYIQMYYKYISIIIMNMNGLSCIFNSFKLFSVKRHRLGGHTCIPTWERHWILGTPELQAASRSVGSRWRTVASRRACPPSLFAITRRSLPPGAERPQSFPKLKLQGIEMPARYLPIKVLWWHKAMGLLPVAGKLTQWKWLNWNPL